MTTAPPWTKHSMMRLIDPTHHSIVQRWLDRGDGIACYRNQAMDSSNFGHRQFVSYGSDEAQLPGDTPPTRLPDIGGAINWPYQLEATHR